MNKFKELCLDIAIVVLCVAIVIVAMQVAYMALTGQLK